MERLADPVVSFIRLALVAVAISLPAGCDSVDQRPDAPEPFDRVSATAVIEAAGRQPAGEQPAAPQPPPEPTQDSALDELLAGVEIPPAWLADVQTDYDTDAHPWDEGRLEIRRLLGLNTVETHREALKLTWMYLQKGDIGDGHEYPMYTFLGAEPLWSIVAHEEFIQQPHDILPVHSYLYLAALFIQFEAFERAEAVLQTAMDGLPDPPWRIMRTADIADVYGDLYAAWGKPDDARRYYAQAIEAYPQADPPYGGHLLPQRAAKVQTKLELLDFRALDSTQLNDGTYTDSALGYFGDIDVTVVIEGGKIADITLRHEETIEQNACVLIPQRIVEAQSLEIDGISGATVTKDAIVNGTYRCLKQAGLQ